MHPDIKLEIDEDVPELMFIHALYHGGFDVIVHGDGRVKIKMREVALRNGNVVDFCERRLLNEAMRAWK